MQFAPEFVQTQLVNHCGPASASACLAVLGIDVSQRGFAHFAHIRGSVWTHGASDQALLRGLRNAGATGRTLRAHSTAERREFVAELRSTLAEGRPALLIVDDAGHWVALLGLAADGRFLVMDPNDGDQVFSRWNDRTLLARSVEDPDEAGELHYAISLARKDGRAPRWQLTPELVRLCESTGAYDTADAMHADLVGLLARTPRGGPRVALGAWLRARANLLVDSVDDQLAWFDDEITRRHLAEHLEAYAVVADAARLDLSAETPAEMLLVPLAVVLTKLALDAEL